MIPNLSRFSIATTAAVFFIAACVRAEEKLPAGATIMDRFVEKTGGKEAYSRIHNRIRRMRVTTPDGESGVTMYEAEPNFKYVESVTPNGIVRAGCNGEIAWRSGYMGVRIRTDERRDQEILEAFFHMPLKWREVYAKAECTEIVELKGQRCYKVVLTPKYGMPQTRYFAVDSGLHVATERTVETALGKINIRMFMSDYKPVDGILYPHKLEQELRGQVNSVVTIDSIEHNVEMPKDRFAVPPEVTEALKKQ